MDLNRFTEKAQEAVASPATGRPVRPAADRRGACLPGPAGQEDGLAAMLEKAGAPLDRLKERVAGAGKAAARQRRFGRHGVRHAALERLMRRAEDEAKQLKDEYVSADTLLLAMTRRRGRDPAILREFGLTRERLMEALKDVRGNQRVTSQNPEGTYEALEKYGRDLTQFAREQARSGHRPRRGDPPRHPGAVAPHQEQPGADRRAGRRQDRHRRRPGPAHRPRRRAGRLEGQAHRRPRHGRADRRRQVPRRVRGAAQGGAEGSAGVAGRDHPVHRRTAHRRRRGQGRGRDGRRQPAQADAGARRAALHRRHDARRIPQAHREGRGPGTPLPAGAWSISRRWRTRSRSCAACKERYESAPQVRIKDAALVAAAVLSNRYITDRFLPDKAIDLVDEAAAKLRTEIDSMPAELDEITPADHAARDRARSAEEGEGRRVEGSAGASWRRSWPTEGQEADARGAVADGEGRRAAAAASCASRSSRRKAGDRAGRAAVRLDPRRRAEVRQAAGAGEAS